MLLLRFIFAVIICAISHELGHWMVAKYYGYSIKFRFKKGSLFGIPIPRGIWNMPIQADREQQITIALAGFQCEILIAMILLPFLWQAAVIAIIHFFSYRFYAGEENDFNWII